MGAEAARSLTPLSQHRGRQDQAIKSSGPGSAWLLAAPSQRHPPCLHGPGCALVSLVFQEAVYTRQLLDLSADIRLAKPSHMAIPMHKAGLRSVVFMYAGDHKPS